LVQTPSGVPAIAPQRMLPAVEEKCFGAPVLASSVMSVAPNGKAKYMPNRLV
jgi:hypothetical protein